MVTVISVFVDKSKEILKGNLVGVYLHGSAVMECYKSRRKTHRLACGMKAAFLCKTTFLLLDLYIDFII